MYFHVYSFKLQIHAHIYRSFIRHHKMLGVRIAKRKTSLKSRAKANPCGTKLRARIFFGADKFASQTYPAGELKSRGKRVMRRQRRKKRTRFEEAARFAAFE